MTPFLIDAWGTASNSLLRNLDAFVMETIKHPMNIDSPELFEGQIHEWLGEHGKSFKRCRWQSVVTMIRDYKPVYNGSKHCPCLRIFYEGQDGLGLFLIMAIGFREEIDNSLIG
jgi:hypothetical protein